MTYFNSGGSTITSGSPVIIGSVVGIAQVDIAPGASGSVVVDDAVVELGKTASLAISQGDKLYINTGTLLITKTNTDKQIGFAFEDSASAATTVLVSLQPSIA